MRWYKVVKAMVNELALHTFDSHLNSLVPVMVDPILCSEFV